MFPTRITQATIMMVVLALAAVGVISVREHNMLPATAVLEALFFGLIIAVRPGLDRRLGFGFGISGLYVAYFFSRGWLYGGANILDVAVAVKCYVYLIVIAYLVGKQSTSSSGLERLFNWLLGLYFVKYAYGYWVSPGLRLGVFTENNFELMALFVLAAGVWRLKGGASFRDLLLLVGITFFSGSRSGVAEFGVLLLFWASFQARGRRSGRVTALVLAFFLTSAIAYGIVQRRGVGSIEDIDRFGFLQLFLEESRGWSAWEWLVGNSPLTRLSASTCDSLSFYSSLLSYSGDGGCYSVLFHSMLLRMIYDHGFVGLACVLWYLMLCMKTAGFDWFLIFVVISILMVNGVSVSSFNSVYAALPIALIVSVRKRNADLSGSFACAISAARA